MSEQQERQLDKLTIRGFKSIESLENFPLKSLNLLIGANGAGKSNLIEFFYMLRNLMDDNLLDYVRRSGGVDDLLFNGPKETSQMEFATKFGPRGYRFTLKPGPLGTCWLTEEARYYEHGETGWWELGNSPDGRSLLAQEAKSKTRDSYLSKQVYNAIISWKIYHFHDTSASAGMRRYEIIQDNKTLRLNASNIAPYLLYLREQHPAAYQEIVEALRLAMPFFEDFLLDVTEFGESQKVNLSWRQKISDYPMQPYHLSDGSIRFICLTTALLQPQPPAAIIIDEPELGLHPLAIAILAELIQNASRKTQLIVATQSPALIDHFSVEDVIVVNRREGGSIFERLQEKDYKAWLEKYSVGELWVKNVISASPIYE